MLFLYDYFDLPNQIHTNLNDKIAPLKVFWIDIVNVNCLSSKHLLSVVKLCQINTTVRIRYKSLCLLMFRESERKLAVEDNKEVVLSSDSSDSDKENGIVYI